MRKRMMSNSLRTILVVLFPLLTTHAVFAQNTKLQLSLSGVDTLANGYHYEGWAIIDAAPVSTGKFNVDASGGLVDLSGNTILNGEFDTGIDLTSASAIIITIEPAGDTDAIPAATHFVAGSVSNASATLSVGDAAALGDDFSTASGQYILATPTDTLSTDENSGIWFLQFASTLTMSFTGLQPLANGFHYEGWAIIEGAPVTTGKFNADTAGALIDLDGNTIPDGEFITETDLGGATAIIITIEPAGDTDVIPAATHYVAGSVSDGSATLLVGDAAALGDDFSTATGKYILATPTDTVTTNENNGIWFLDLSSGSPAQGLSIPTLPAGWVYEGWGVLDGIPITTGRFIDPAASDSSAPYSGSEAGPPFPGEDFLQNAPAGLTFPIDLAGGTAVISIEPSPDDDPGPFTLKPLVHAIPDTATDHLTYSMDNNTGGFPTGTAIITVAAVQGLQIASLPAGWVYEGWVVIDGTPVTTGRFIDPAAADSSAPYSGSESGPPFPGEDFLLNAPAGLTFPTDLAGGTAVISIEPSPDDAPGPFTLKPLVGAIPDTATDQVTYALGNQADGFPSGTATIPTAVGVVSPVEIGLPEAFRLAQNFPNPFNPSTTIRYDLPEASRVNLVIYDLAGREVATLVHAEMSAGRHVVSWDAGAALPSGVYLYRLQAGAFVQARKLLLLK